jgi:signal transduction histidine kinase
MQGLSGWVMQHGKPALSLKDELDQRESTAVRRRRQDTESGSIIVVPLLYRDRILGTLTAINSDDEPDFEKHDVNLMQAMASQAAVAIENTRLYTAEREQVQELKESNEALQSFSHMVAHDLKGPLSIIVGYAELITVYDQDRNFTKEEIFAYVQTMLATGHKMSTIINDLLMLANIRRQEEMPLKPLKIGEVIDEVLLRMHWGVEKAQARIIKPEKWPAAVGYSPWVEENWVNYISNALKYGGERPTIILGYDENWPGDLDQIRFYVQDNGDGLTAEEQTHLFKEFSRVGQHKIRGHGLGLSIVRRITERMGGTVGVESQPGKGSIFYFTLPKEGQEEGLQNTIPDRIR